MGLQQREPPFRRMKNDIQIFITIHNNFIHVRATVKVLIKGSFINHGNKSFSQIAATA